MKRALAVACAVLAASGLSGCRTLRQIPRAAPMPASPDRVPGAEGLLVFVAESTSGQLTGEELAAPDTDKARRLEAVDEERLRKYGRALRAALAEAIQRAGMAATVDPWSGAELVATATSEVRPELEWDLGGVSVSTRSALVLSTPHGKPLAKVEVSVPASDEDVLDTAEALDRRLEAHARRVAAELVRALPGAPELAAYLEGRRTRRNIAALMKQEEEKQAAASSEVEQRVSTDLRSARDAAAAFISGGAQPAAHGLVIGVERYADGKTGNVGARSDATRFAGLMLRTLGVPEENARLAVDEGARRADLEREVQWLAGSAKGGQGRLYFFFSGSVVIEPRSGTPWLWPHDRSAASPASGLKLEAVLKRLADSGVEVLAVIDACRVGKGRPKPVKLPAKVALVEAPLEGCAQGELALHVTEGLGTARADADGDRAVTLDELRDFVGKRMNKEGAQAARFELGKGVTGVTFNIAEGLEEKK